jgi:nucleoid-associated protein YgaU
MSAWSALGPGTRVLILLAGGAGLVGTGYLGWRASQPDPTPAAVSGDTTSAASEGDAATESGADTLQPDETVAATKPATAEDIGTAISEEAEASAPAETAQDDLAEVPVIETWRVDADGEAVVSGSAVPGAKVEVLVDGAVVASGPATGTGEFALVFTLPPNPKPSLMWLSMTPEGGTGVASEERVALGPIKGPELAAAEEPTTEDTAATASSDAPAALLLSDEGAVVLQEPDPAPEALAASVMIDTITYTPEGEVQVGGRAAAGAALRLYLDNAEKLTLDVPEGGLWVTTLPDIPPGIYTLRADQLDGAGKVTSRFETPFKRETLADLALASAGDPVPEPGPEPSAEEPVAEEPVLAPADPPTETASPELPEASAEAQSEPAVASDPVTEAEPEAEATVEPVPAAAPPAPVTITVQPGFTLWGIAQAQMGDGVMYVQVFDANRDKIKDPDLIYPGQVFTMPAASPSP